MKTIDIKIRKNWGYLCPVARIHGNGKQDRKPKYGKRDRNSWRKELV
jgi:hypothetical protein